MANPPAQTEKSPESGSIVLSARAVAIELLEAVLKRRKPLDEALAEHPDLDRLVNRDRQFVRALVTCTLRHLGQIDHVLAQCLEKPLPARASAIRNILRLGTAQTLFLKTPAHAAVDTMVTLAGKRGGEAGYKGLVNAVLRRITREADLFRQFAPGSGNFILGTVAYRSGKRVEWDAEKLQVTSSPEAQELIHKEYRKGWTL